MEFVLILPALLLALALMIDAGRIFWVRQIADAAAAEGARLASSGALTDAEAEARARELASRGGLPGPVSVRIARDVRGLVTVRVETNYLPLSGALLPGNPSAAHVSSTAVKVVEP